MVPFSMYDIGTIKKEDLRMLNKSNEVKELIRRDFSEIIIQPNISIGLPEYNDRTKQWRTAILYKDEGVGFVYYDRDSKDLDKNKSSSIEFINKKIKHLDRLKRKSNSKKDNKFYISHLSNMIINGDSLIKLKELPDNSVDMVFTSPPYYNAKTEYSEYIDYQHYLDFLEEIIKEITRVLIPGKFFIINSSPVLIPRVNRYSSSKRIAVPYDIHRIFMDQEYEFMDDIYWVKPEGAGWSAGRGRRFSADRNPMQYKPVPVTENIMVYRKKSDKLIDWYIRKNPNREIIENSKVKDGYEVTNIWKINPAKDRRHPAIFPIELAEKVITYYSFKNDVILDPFGGLGTTAKAALNLDRRFVSIELDRDYFEESIKDIDRDYGISFNDIKVIR